MGAAREEAVRGTEPSSRHALALSRLDAQHPGAPQEGSRDWPQKGQAAGSGFSDFLHKQGIRMQELPCGASSSKASPAAWARMDAQKTRKTGSTTFNPGPHGRG